MRKKRSCVHQGVRFRRRTRGASVVEFSLLCPWLIFLYVGAFDWGFYAHALISTENASRSAALYAANNAGTTPSASAACNIVLQELSIASNVTGLTTCTAAPVVVSLSCTTNSSLEAVQVTVAYTTLQLIPIPGLLENQVTLNRTTEMPLATQSGSCSIGS